MKLTVFIVHVHNVGCNNNRFLPFVRKVATKLGEQSEMDFEELLPPWCTRREVAKLFSQILGEGIGGGKQNQYTGTVILVHVFHMH